MLDSAELIIVPCHSIWKQTNLGESLDDWYLEPFQKEGSDHLIFIKQITTGVSLLKQRPNGYLLFSGGQTKKAAGPVSEALSYYELAKKLNVFHGIEDRINLEEFAKDSFENVLFSIARFHEIHNYYPTKITIVGFEFKRKRFEELHLKKGLHWNGELEYIGFELEPIDGVDKDTYLKDIEQSELKFAFDLFKKDPLGNGTVLSQKKAKRNPFNKYHAYLQSNPLLAPLFGEHLPVNFRAPWEE